VNIFVELVNKGVTMIEDISTTQVRAMKKDEDNNGKIVKLEDIWRARGRKRSITTILKDTKRIAMAIQKRTCVLCDTAKNCVNKTGLCVSCYRDLSPRQKKVADEEAQHKRVEFFVTDDRWKMPEDQ
jgi:hypothetical protein